MSFPATSHQSPTCIKGGGGGGQWLGIAKYRRCSDLCDLPLLIQVKRRGSHGFSICCCTCAQQMKSSRNRALPIKKWSILHYGITCLNARGIPLFWRLSAKLLRIVPSDAGTRDFGTRGRALAQVKEIWHQFVAQEQAQTRE